MELPTLASRGLWRGREPICSVLALPEVGCTLQIQALCSRQKGGNPGSLNRHRGGWRAQGGGGGLKMRPWHLIKYQLQITRNVDPGGADLQRFASTKIYWSSEFLRHDLASGAPIWNPLDHQQPRLPFHPGFAERRYRVVTDSYEPFETRRSHQAT